MNDIIFKPYLEKYKTPLGALNSLETVILNIYIRQTFQITDLKIVVFDEMGDVLNKNMDYVNTEDEYNHYTVSFFLAKPYIYWYYFEFNDCYGHHYIGRDESLNATLCDRDVLGFQLNVKHYEDADFSWFQGKVIYQILVDRFNKAGNNPPKTEGYLHKTWDDIVCYGPINDKYNEDFFGGDLQGVMEKLPYLKSLNVGIIYLNPIFLAPTSHKYNTSNYMMIDPMYGDESLFKKLCEEARKLGIYIILDGVFNHTGDDSIYFNKYNRFPELGAYQSKNSKFYSWYDFVSHPYMYRSWWGIKSLPSVNQNSSFVDFITGENGVIDKWMQAGAKGFRLDVVDELNDDFVRRINQAIKRNDKDGMCLGEVWEDATNKISYGRRKTYFNGEELDSVMNYVIKDAIIDYLKKDDLLSLVYRLREEINNYPFKARNSLMNILSTHDTVRILTMFSKVNEHSLSPKEKAAYKMSKEDYYCARSKMKMALTIIYTLPGVPCIYYGDETGLEGYGDPFCRRTLQWDKIDDDLNSYIKLLGKIRKSQVFIDGNYEEICIENNVFVYSRAKNNQKYIMIINNSNRDYKLNLYNYFFTNNALDLIDDVKIEGEVIVYAQTSKIIQLV